MKGTKIDTTLVQNRSPKVQNSERQNLANSNDRPVTANNNRCLGVTSDGWLLSKDFSTTNCQGTKQLSPVCKKMSMAAISALNATRWIVLSQQRPTQKGFQGHGHASKPEFCSAISVTYKWLSIIVVTGCCCLEGTVTAMLQFHSTAGGFIWRVEVFTSQNKKGLWNSPRKESFEPSSILETLAVFEGSFASTSSCKILEHGTRRRAAAAVWRDLPNAAVPNGHPALLRSWRKSPVEDSTGKSWDH